MRRTISICTGRGALIARIEARVEGYDAVVLPTVPVVAPRMDELDSAEEYDRVNQLVLRNPRPRNMLGRPAITLPCGLAIGCRSASCLWATRARMTRCSDAASLEAVIAAPKRSLEPSPAALHRPLIASTKVA